MSLSFAYENLRQKLSSENKVLWIYLTHDAENRHTNKKEFDKYEEPDNVFTINTDENSVDEALNLSIEKYENTNNRKF